MYTSDEIVVFVAPVQTSANLAEPIIINFDAMLEIVKSNSLENIA